MAASISALWSNLALWLPISAALGVQFYKYLWEWRHTGAPDVQVLFRTGGMPSSHSAMVTSLATVLAVQHGLGSPLFAVAVIAALVVMYDARGVRHQSGQHARILNQILRELFSGQPISEQELKELLGHTPTEVIVGSIVGISYSLLILYLVG
ncbi:MAG: divergent PAP2 family protein [Litorilinea sp.]